VGVHVLGWIIFGLIWIGSAVRGARQGNLFAPTVEGGLLAVLMIVLQFFAVYIWGDVTGRWWGVAIWIAAGLLGLTVLILRWRERVFIRDYVIDESAMAAIAHKDPLTDTAYFHPQEMILYLIRERSIRPDVAQAIVERCFNENHART